MEPNIALVVDDDDALRRYVAALLRAEGFQVAEARDGIAGLVALRELGPSVRVVVADILMPGADGITFYENAAADYPSLPFVFMTGYATSERLVSIPTHYPLITKPFTAEALVACIRSVLPSFTPRAKPARKHPSPESPLVYVCECGRKWTFSRASAPTSQQCACGRSIIVQHGAVLRRRPGPLNLTQKPTTGGQLEHQE